MKLSFLFKKFPKNWGVRGEVRIFMWRNIHSVAAFAFLAAWSRM
jgi:hypothetical protein